MIDKITPRALDKSSDHKLVPKTSMIDALNMYISEDSMGDEGNTGVLKNIKGNKNVEYGIGNDYPINPGVGFKVIGSVTDSLTHICYFFVWSEDARDHGVWAYDKYGKLPQGAGSNLQAPNGIENSIRKIFTSSQFNFPEHGFVKGDVVHKSGSEFYRKGITQGGVDVAATLEAQQEWVIENVSNGTYAELGDAIPALELILQSTPNLFNVYESNSSGDLYPEIVEWLDSPRRSKLKGEFERGAILYFTDNENEPRKINIYRALLNQLTHIGGYDAISVADFICACPKAPLKKITFNFSADSDRPVNNFATSPGFQFAYQNVYIDGTESAISTYSDIAFPPSITHRGAAEASLLLAHNLCSLNIPRVGVEISEIKILARYGNTANFFEIDQVSTTTDDSTSNWSLTEGSSLLGVYKFYNDRVASGVSPKEVLKTFDNLPQKAQAQTTIANRLVYGNYQEGYDNVKTSCDSTVVYNIRPQDFINLTIDAKPSIEPTGFGQNRCAGFQIDTTELPANVTAGTTIEIQLNYTPNKNFHIYQAERVTHLNGKNSYHQSRNLGKYSSNATGYRRWPLSEDHNYFFEGGEALVDGFNNTHLDSPADYQERGFEDGESVYDSWFSNKDSGADYLKSRAQPFFGNNKGVGAASGDGTPHLPLWYVKNTHSSYNPNHDPSGHIDYTNGHRAAYGTSAGNPLILQTQKLTFEVKFIVTVDLVGNAKSVIGETVTEALAGADGTDAGGYFTYANSISINTEDVSNTVKITKGEYDLGLGYETGTGPGQFNMYYNEVTSGFQFPNFQPSDPFGSLVCGVRADHYVENDAEQEGNVNAGYTMSSQGHIPFSYFIINRAEIDFYLEKVGGGHGNKHLRLCISKIDVEPEDIMTCFKKIDPRSPWWAIHPSSIQNPNFGASMSSYDPALYNGFSTQYNTVTNTNDENYNASELEIWQNSLGYKFNIPNNLLTAGHGDRVTPYDSFVAGFDPSPEASGFSEGMPTNEGLKWCNLGFCGYMETAIGFEVGKLYKPHNDDNSDYIPKLGQSRFRFSLMDGEGGPGGENAGENLVVWEE